MKYIDADKLKAEIERLKKHSEESKKEWIDEGYNQNAFAEDCRIKSFDKLLAFIDSLQQEQPDEHYTKRNELFDKCVANCDPKVIQEVSDNVDKLRAISTPAEEDWFEIDKEWEKEDKRSVTDCDTLEEAADDHIRKVADAAGHPGRGRAIRSDMTDESCPPFIK